MSTSTRLIIVVALLVAAGCHGKAEEAAQTQRVEKMVDERAHAIAEELVQKNEAEEAQARQAAAAQAIQKKREQRQAVIDHPEHFLDAHDLDVTPKGTRRLTSITINNRSLFPMTDVHGTVDFHGSDDQILAQIPITLTGSIAAGASMVFSDDQKTITGASIRINEPVVRVDFTIGGVGEVGGADDSTAASADDGGIH